MSQIARTDDDILACSDVMHELPARRAGCSATDLDPSIRRSGAHRFHFVEDLVPA